MKTKRRIILLSFCLSFALAITPITVFAEDSVFTAETSAGSAAVSAASDAAVLPASQIEELDGNTIVATTEWQDYTVSKPDTSVSDVTFDVRVPGKGYLSMYAADAGSSGYSVSIKTKGFKDYEYLYSDNPLINVGVREDTYTFTVRTYAESVSISLKYVKVKEGKFGTSRKKASTLKKKSSRNALIITNAKKTHWYKLKNKNGKKMTITFKAALNGGGGYGGLKVTAYQGSKNIGSGYVYSDTSKKVFTITTTLSSKKAIKGTYYLKIQSYKGGNGKFSVKWK